jgi:hypothetical protein
METAKSRRSVSRMITRWTLFLETKILVTHYVLQKKHGTVVYKRETRISTKT